MPPGEAGHRPAARRALQQALLAYLMPMAGPPTFIWRGDTKSPDGDGRAREGKPAPPVVFGQLRHRLGEEHARLLYLAPVLAGQTNAWLPLLDHAGGAR